jgi:predicted dienelactone hydrolase
VPSIARLPARAAVLSLALAASLAWLSGCGDSSSPGAGSSEILTDSRTFIDASRPTAPNGAFPGAPERRLETRIWVREDPLRGSPACTRDGCALVLLAHGFGGNTGRFDAYARSLASAGYVVAALAFPLTNDAAPGGHTSALGDVVNQPTDVTFVIDALLAAAGTDGDLLSGRIDASRIGAMGHSLGGATVLAATRADCCTDARIDAVVGVAPVGTLLEPVFGAPAHRDGPPILILNGSLDPVITPALSTALYESLAAPRALVVIPGAGHSDLIEASSGLPRYLGPSERASIAFFDAHLGGEPDALAPVLEELAAEGNDVRFE